MEPSVDLESIGAVENLDTTHMSMAMITPDNCLGVWLKLDRDDMEMWEFILSHAQDPESDMHVDALEWAAETMTHWMLGARVMYPSLRWDKHLLQGQPLDHPDWMHNE